MKSLILFFSFAFCVSLVEAKDFDGEYAVFGAGAQTCENYLGARRRGEEPTKTYRDWVFAYFSAFNVIVNNTYNIAGSRGTNEVLNWLDNYCSGSKRALFVSAVADLTQRLYPQRANISPNSDNKAKWEGLTGQ